MNRPLSPILVVKYGGAVMADASLADAWAADVSAAIDAGWKVVVVHGGGPALTRMLDRLGIATKFEGGHRVTDADSADVAAMVLSGIINTKVVARLTRAGVQAIGMSGTDAGLLTVAPLRPSGRDIGFVGEVASVDTDVLSRLLDAGFTPVLSSTATDASGQIYNINADLVAGSIAAALQARELIVLSDVPGLIADGQLVRTADRARVHAALDDGTAQDGMRPKLEGAIVALDAGVRRVRLIDGRSSHALKDALEESYAGGTCLTADAHDSPEVIMDPRLASSPEVLPAPDLTSSIMGTYARYPIEIVSGSGCRVTASDGRSYLDFASGIAVNALGHGHPAIVAALQRASRGVLHTSNLYWTRPMLALAARLTEASGMERAFFCNSGTEAIETALKIARKARPGRKRIVVFERSFHGRTLGSLSATMQSAYQDPFRPLVPGFVAVPYGDFAAATDAIDAQTAAVLAEPIQGEGGVRPAPDGWLAHLRRRCDETGALFMLDEVQTGMGRTGTLFAYQQAGDAHPDVVACAKALAGGLPMGAVLARGEAAGILGPGDHGSTFGGGPFVASVASAVLDTILDPAFLAAVRLKESHLANGLRRLARRHPALVLDARGRGLMWGLVLSGPHAPDLVARIHERAVLTVPSGKDVLRLLPPLTISREEIDEAIGAVDGALGALAITLAAEPEAAHAG